MGAISPGAVPDRPGQSTPTPATRETNKQSEKQAKTVETSKKSFIAPQEGMSTNITERKWVKKTREDVDVTTKVNNVSKQMRADPNSVIMSAGIHQSEDAVSPQQRFDTVFRELTVTANKPDLIAITLTGRGATPFLNNVRNLPLQDAISKRDEMSREMEYLAAKSESLKEAYNKLDNPSKEVSDKFRNLIIIADAHIARLNSTLGIVRGIIVSKGGTN